MSGASIVYMSTGRLLIDPPGRVRFHLSGRSEWPSYPENPEKPGTAMRVGEERHWTRCGLLTYDSSMPRAIRLHGIRRDNAALVGRPCRRCEP